MRPSQSSIIHCDPGCALRAQRLAEDSPATSTDEQTTFTTTDFVAPDDVKRRSAQIGSRNGV